MIKNNKIYQIQNKIQYFVIYSNHLLKVLIMFVNNVILLYLKKIVNILQIIYVQEKLNYNFVQKIIQIQLLVIYVIELLVSVDILNMIERKLMEALLIQKLILVMFLVYLNVLQVTLMLMRIIKFKSTVQCILEWKIVLVLYIKEMFKMK